MMRSAFKERLDILRINISNSYQVETAYFANNLGGLLSTLIFTLTYLVFINVIFSNVKTMAGYSKDEMLFLILMGQTTFYLLSSLSMDNNDQMITDVNRGNLDLLLVKPLPTLFYISLRNVNLLAMARDGVIPCVFVVAAIHWQNLTFTPLGNVLGFLALIFGLLAADTVKFLLSIPVFWKGEAQEISGLFYALTSNNFPLEGLQTFMRISFTIIIPVIIGDSVSASIFLGKSPAWPLFGLAVGMGVLCLCIKSLAWRLALRNYSSASS